MPTPITRFRCDHCKKHYSINSDAKRHEAQCFFNPEVKSCVTCNHASIKEVADNEGRVEYSYGYCFVLSKQIFRKGYPVKRCSGWEEIVYDENGDSNEW